MKQQEKTPLTEWALRADLHRSRLAVGDEPRQGLLQQFQKLPQVVGYLVELWFVQ
ncbi:hypothetical protein [Streptomyces sp. NBC_00358]|jgi:hypothetical protein|uniref:hypothetical protein n=1 Tax=Streptomyces sp. NBC_00358 TaxID=2975725 RepID=UPI002E276D9F